MRTKTIVLTVTAITVTSLALSASAVTFSGIQLSNLIYTTPGAGATAGYVSPNAVLTSPDNVSGGTAAEFNDTGIVELPSGYMGSAPLGTLSSILAAGAAGNVSFNLVSQTPSANTNFYAYWNLELKNGANTMIINAYSDNKTGANPLNEGASVDASAYLLNGTTFDAVFQAWTTLTGQVVDGLALGSWSVTGLTISDGGWDSSPPNGTTAVISSITVPGAVPDSASTLSLLGIGFGAVAGLRRRLQRA